MARVLTVTKSRPLVYIGESEGCVGRVDGGRLGEGGGYPIRELQGGRAIVGWSSQEEAHFTPPLAFVKELDHS